MINRAAGFYWVRSVGEPNAAHAVRVAEWEPDSLVEEGGRWLHTGDDGCAYGDDGIEVLSERLTPPDPGLAEHHRLCRVDVDNQLAAIAEQVERTRRALTVERSASDERASVSAPSRGSPG